MGKLINADELLRDIQEMLRKTHSLDSGDYYVGFQSTLPVRGATGQDSVGKAVEAK